ncbi:MAG: hypothetical protein HYV77_02835 [Candidatus Wildermuthbacteria bacterium]|nr:hypothetical protein [Candidatus Wildermuthbacteria bacterium]
MKYPLAVKIFLGIIIAVIVGAVIAGFFLIGSPSKQRAIELDQRRVSDLQSISYAVDSYYSTNTSFPNTFAQLQGQEYYISSVVDPSTKEQYGYRTIDEKTYELCAVFETSSDDISDRRYGTAPKPFQETWEHGTGRVCFPRRIVEEGNPSRMPMRSVPVN